MAQEFGGKVRFTIENYGDSALAKRYGLTHYPAIFVDDILVATPKDFGFYGKEQGSDKEGGRYAPLRKAESHERFRSDLHRMLELLLAGKKDAARDVAAPSREGEIASFPDVRITDLDGKVLTRADLAGRPVLVEIWATWCPPCRSTLAWLGELKARHGDRLAIVTLAIESDETNVRKLAAQMKLPVTWAMGPPELVRAFGDVGAVPTLLLFGGDGRTAAVFYGAPPTLHGDAEAKLASLLKPPPAS